MGLIATFSAYWRDMEEEAMKWCQRRRECASAGRSKNASLTMRGETVLRDAGFSGVTAN
jgi:hypothetical protein